MAAVSRVPFVCGKVFFLLEKGKKGLFKAHLKPCSYWRRASNALASGFIPQTAELADSLNAVFGVSVTPDSKLVALPERASVKVCYYKNF